MDRVKALNILGFSPDENPDEAEINKAFKKRAVKLHPDVNKSENAEKDFKELNAAQDFLKNPAKEEYSNFNPFVSSLQDFLRNGPSIHFSIKPIYVNVSISFTDSVLGSSKTISVDKTSRCETCACKQCNGCGSINHTSSRGSFMFTTSQICSTCKGTGRANQCTECHNKGLVSNKSEFDVKIPGGITNGQSIRLRGAGNVENNNGILHAGDIILTAFVSPDKDMTVRGMDVISNIDIPLVDALRGTSKVVRTVLGDKTIQIKTNTKHTDIVILNNHGVEKQGKHVFVINVLYPKHTEKLIKMLEEEEK